MLLTKNVLEAVQLFDSKAPVGNGCYTDTTNPSLWTADLRATCGIGNVARSVAILRTAFAYFLRCTIREINVRFFAEHYVEL